METTIAFLFGLIYGSFLNVVILRYDDWVSIATTRSHCPGCRTELKWYDLIPVISFLSLTGRCRYCRQPISWQYPVVELTTAFLLTAGYLLVFNQPIPLIEQILAFSAFVIAAGALMVMFFHDLKEMMIPDLIAYVFLIAALVFSLFYYQQPILTFYGLLVGLLPIALLVYPSRGKWMGEGDVKLAAGLGMLAGYPNAIVFIGLAFILGAVVGFLMILSKKAQLKSAVPFGPFLITGGLIALIIGTQIVEWYLGIIGYGYY